MPNGGSPQTSVDYTQHNQYNTRNYGTHQAAACAKHVGRPLPPEGVERRKPVHQHSHRQRVIFIGGKSRIETLRPEYVGQRGGSKHQHRRKPYHYRLPFEIHRRPSPAGTERLRDPPVEAAAHGIRGGQLGAHQRERQQKHYGCKKIVEYRLHTVGRLRRQPSQTQYRGSDEHGHGAHCQGASGSRHDFLSSRGGDGRLGGPGGSVHSILCVF